MSNKKKKNKVNKLSYGKILHRGMNSDELKDLQKLVISIVGMPLINMLAVQLNEKAARCWLSDALPTIGIYYNSAK